MKRIFFTGLFALTCIAAGFMLATGWEMPTAISAQPFNTQSITVPAASVPLVDDDGNSPFVLVAEKVQPVVVNIQAEKEIAGHKNLPFDMFDFGPFFGEPPRSQGSVPMPKVTSGGSGIIIGEDGLILTNNHVISEATDITVKFADGSERQAEIIGTDPETDVALIKVDGDIPPQMVAKLGDSDKIRIGEWAIAIGNPFGLDWTLTVGVISARGRSNLFIGGGDGPSFQNFIQTDASINYGNSGGPLVNIRGEVIGINTAINAQGQGIGFAIPINQAKSVIEQLQTSGEVHRGYLGVYPSELTPVKREALGVDMDIKGVFIESVESNTPAEKGGMESGDVVIEINSEKVLNLTDFRFKIAGFAPDSKVKMTVWRRGKIESLGFKLGERSEYIDKAVKIVKQPQSWLGIEVAETNSREGMRYGVQDIKGVVVLKIAVDSPAQGLLSDGDVIVELGGEEIRDTKDFEQMAKKLNDRKKAIPFWVIREGRRTFIPIRP